MISAALPLLVFQNDPGLRQYDTLLRIVDRGKNPATLPMGEGA